MVGGDTVPHVLLFPFPIQGHLSPMLKLAKLFSQANLRVTFVNTEHIHERLQQSSSSSLDWLSQQPLFRFRTIPDGLSKNNPRSVLHILDMEQSMRIHSRERYRELLVPASNQEPDEWPPVDCVVADGFLTVAVEVPEEMEVPVMILRTSSACSVLAYWSTPDLLKLEELPFQNEDGLDKPIQGVAGMESFLRQRDLPSPIRRAKSITDGGLQFVSKANANLNRGKALILNTFESLEAPVLSRIRSICPVTYTLGPLHVLDKSFSNSSNAFPLSSNSSSLWREDRKCMEWLDTQPNKSVIYVSFGSLTVLSRDQLAEFWNGLVNSGQRFLWVVRPDLVDGETKFNQIQSEMEEQMRERGCLVEWAPQEAVLAHPAVGCFLTHSGWNSTLESIVAGVPMICWPFIADQMINSRFVDKVWKIGVDMKDVCDRNIIERMVREVMVGDKAVELRKAAEEMALLARRSAEEGGSSYTSFQNLIQHIKSLSSLSQQRLQKGDQNKGD